MLNIGKMRDGIMNKELEHVKIAVAFNGVMLALQIIKATG